MSDAYVDGVRKTRDKSVVLKTRVLTVRSSKKNTPIVIFEGKTDLGPYDVWIRRIAGNLDYIPIPSSGKGQSLDFYVSIITEDLPRNKYIYFVVDHDFDGLRGVQEDEIIFCTDAYSMENYLVTNEALRSILNDEFEVSDEIETIEKIIAIYQKVLHEACVALSEANKRIFFAQNNGLGGGSKEDKINKYIDIDLLEVKKNYPPELLQSLVPLLREPTDEEFKDIEAHFSSIECMHEKYRGKYLLDFFINWLSILAEDRRESGALFGAKKKVRFDRAQLTHRSLASRVNHPNQFDIFINKILQDSRSTT